MRLLRTGALLLSAVGAVLVRGVGPTGSNGVSAPATTAPAKSSTPTSTGVPTSTGRIDSYSWRSALISGGLPDPLTGAAASSAIVRWQGLRGCTGLRAAPSTAP